jgi:hypothetical protein
VSALQSACGQLFRNRVYRRSLRLAERRRSCRPDGARRSAHRTSPSNVYGPWGAERVAEVGFEMRIWIVGSGKIGTGQCDNADQRVGC